ncbi:MAG TPA: aldo/keto reductase [Firmicutes bacterium]|nr:aldo/keto reductase [Bacillota bacterium]
MIYRTLGKQGLKVSCLGLGGVPMNHMAPEKIISLIRECHDYGINLIDIYMAQTWLRDSIGAAIAGKREEYILQGHIGTMEEDGNTVRTRNLSETKASFDALRRSLKSDYIDVGMLYFIDSDEDYRNVFESEIIEYAQKLKDDGIIRSIGMGSHNPATALRAVRTGLIDVLMFSINPAYDMASPDADIDTLKDHEGFSDSGMKIDPARQKLYAFCEQNGTSITVMKSLGAGTLLSATASPFGKALTVPQCIQYGLDRPAVASVILGLRNSEEVKGALSYFDTSAEERDYSYIFHDHERIVANGRCMYCNHCQPCPEGIDIASVTKYLDIALVAGEVTATIRDHYNALKKNADDCIACRSCEERCPFSVSISENMSKAQEVFS